MKHINIKVTGKVQGVFLEQAQRLLPTKWG